MFVHDAGGDSRWSIAAWALAAVMAAGLSSSVLRIPVQTTDSLIPIIDAHRRASVLEAFTANLHSAAYLRPARIGQIQLIYELSGGRYTLAYKGFHVALILACVGLFTLALRPRTKADFSALCVALTVLTGLHTFYITLAEGYPINHFLEIVVLCLFTLVLAQSRGGWWADLAAATAFALAALTLESGLLVWVVAVAAWMTGLRGISTRGAVAMTLLLAGYLYLRFVYLDVGGPLLDERSSGFGTVRLEAEELLRRFGAWPYGFYAYNVASSLLTVLLSEPRGGVWEAVAEAQRGALTRASVLTIASSAITSGALIWYIAHRARDWRTWTLTPGDRLVLVAAAVLGANAVISYPYSKDEVMSPAGGFYALAAFVVFRHAAERIAASRRGLQTIAVVALLAVAAGGWALRSVVLHYRLHEMAYYVRNEWADVYPYLASQEETIEDAAERRIVETLREDALRATVVHPGWMESRLNTLVR